MTTDKYRERAESLVEDWDYQTFCSLDDLAARIADLCSQVAEETAPKSCTCTLSDCPDDDYYEATCGETWTLIDGSPDDNNYRFCPGCGGKLVVALPPPSPGVEQ